LLAVLMSPMEAFADLQHTFLSHSLLIS